MAQKPWQKIFLACEEMRTWCSFWIFATCCVLSLKHVPLMASDPVPISVVVDNPHVCNVTRTHRKATRVLTAGSAAAVGFAVGIPSMPGILDNIVLGLLSGVGTFFSCDCPKG